MPPSTRDTDWAATPLGPVDDWPECLRTAAAIVFGCSFPAILVWGPERVQLYNDRYALLIGARHPKALGEPTHETWPEIREHQEAMFLRVYDGESVELTEARYLIDPSRSGVLQEFFFDASLVPVPDERGTIRGSLSVLIDTTTRVRAREVAAEREQLLRELASEHERFVAAQAVTNVGSWETHFPSMRVTWSAQTFKIFGRDPATFSPTHEAFLAHVHPDDRAMVDGAFVASIGARGVCAIEHRIVCADGTVRRVEERWNMHVDATGAPSRAIGTCQDVTARWEADEERRMLTTALGHLTREGVAIIDEDGTFIYTNAAHQRLFGYSADELPSLRIDRFVPDGQRAAFEEIMTRVREGTSWNGVVPRRRLDDGREFLADIIYGAARDAGRWGYIAIVRDATERIAREQHLRRVERVAGLGTMLSGVAHELNNPLTVILGLVQMLLEQPRIESDREDLAMIEREARRIAAIVGNLRLTSTDTTRRGDRAIISLNDVVHQVLRTRAYAMTTRNIVASAELAEDEPMILANRAQIEQMVLHLVINAEQALTAAGTAAPRILIRTAATAKGCLLSVVDNGPGIPRDNLERVFDPFYTTKSPGEGTGLGLSLVHGIVTEHHAEIRVDSELAKGSAFHVEFPHLPSLVPPEPPATQLRVLIVDDEELIRRVAMRLFERRGHIVEQARDGGDALALLRAATAQYDAIVSDLRMPGLNGFELLKCLEELGGGMEKRVIFITGDDSSPDVTRMIEEFGVEILTKPTGLGVLVERVERLVREIGAAAKPERHRQAEQEIIDQ